MERLLDINTLVVKVGSNVITRNGDGLDLDRISSWAYQISRLRTDYGIKTAVVSSGAMASGNILVPGLDKTDETDLQVAAIFGQPALIAAWVEAFRKHGQAAGQALYVDADLNHLQRPLLHALDRGPVVINRNDATSSHGATELKGAADNDWMATHIARAIRAGLLISLTSEDGAINPQDRIIKLIRSGEIVNLKQFAKTKEGTGGMSSKIANQQEHAKTEGNIGVIASGKKPDVIWKIVHGEMLGTWITDRQDIALQLFAEKVNR